MGLLEELLNAHGISGAENEIRQLIRKNIMPYVDDCEVDRFGNLIARQKGTEPKIMVAAHMDEVGFMVKRIDDLGKIHLSAVGSFEPETLLGERIEIKMGKKAIWGIITTHGISDGHGVEKDVEFYDMFIDTGLTKAEIVKAGVQPGTYIDFAMKSGFLGKKDIIFGKALDDRIGCYIVIELAKKLKKTKNEVYFVFTVQEEIGVIGAKVSSYRVEPDLAIAIDVTNANDSKNGNATKVLGNGPHLTIKDEAMITDRRLDDIFIRTAKKKKIPLQLEVADIGATDALGISLSRGGVPSTIMGVPIRNIHTTVGIAHRKDIDNAIRLLYEVLRNPVKLD